MGGRRLSEKRIALASHNVGKLREVKGLLEPFGLEVLSAAELCLEEPDETESSYAGNARIKAHMAAKGSGLPALSDDSGLSVDALDGQPGVYTADWAETPYGRDFGKAMEKVWQKLESDQAQQPWTAAFNCTLCLAWPDGEDRIFEGRVHGALTWPPRGTHGFGFDPMFVPDGYQLTFGEILYEEKAPISHRAAAFDLFVKGCLAP